MSAPAIPKRGRWQSIAWLSAIALALVLLLRADLSHLKWVAELSRQGSPPPARAANSPTGYAYAERYFLGTHERGDTYRWIAATQDLLAPGSPASTTYQADTVPTGRPRLLPKLYSGWLAAVASGVHLVTGEPVGLAVERAALWEPIVVHLLAFIAVVAFVWIRCDAATAAFAALGFVLLPPLSAQFLPGVLTSRTWALLLAACSIAWSLPSRRVDQPRLILSVRAALAAALALWLDPAFGFPAVLVSAAAGLAAILTQTTTLSVLRWSLIGSGATLAAWFIDRSPWDPAAGELRYVHPLYAMAWLGIGLLLTAAQAWRASKRLPRLQWAGIVAGVSLISPLVYTQLKHGYKGWLYSSAALRRLTSLDEATTFNTGFDWLARVSAAEMALTSLPLLAAIVGLSVVWWRRRGNGGGSQIFLPAAVALGGALVFAMLRVRWGVPAMLLAVGVVAHLATSLPTVWRQALATGAGVYLLGLVVWGTTLPPSYRRPAGEVEPSAEDIEALTYRHFAYWLASHPPGQPVSALAPPELSDALVFHGGLRVLLSTAWESYPGQVAASRILSSPEASEAEAVIQSRELTHVILLSWDKALPLFVREPQTPGQTTLYARLQRWVFPPYLRPIPYHLPPIPGLAGQKLAVFKVVPPQDEALSLSRLAEYFVETDREDAADQAARVLAKAFADNPNAVIARAIVYAAQKNTDAFEHELARVAADATAGKSPFAWDRRVQRAIVLALGHRTELARTEIGACLAGASKEDLLDLTPLQAYRLQTLAARFECPAPDAEFARVLAAMGAEYSARSTPPSGS